MSTGRFDQALRQMAPRQFAEQRGLKHREAFCLMWYACPCGHREQYWNSRDGVTPFGTACPSCGGPTMQHVQFGLDTFAPDHRPHLGQRVWVDMTRERAEQYARARIASARAQGHEISDDRFEPLVRSILGEHGGAAPDMRVTGYQQVPA